MLIQLERFAYTPDGTFGRMTIGEETFWTVERPWNGNMPRSSCIPEGVYPLQMRESPMVHRTSGGAFRQGWEICDVPGRSLIMIHPANWASELLGCIAPGMTWGVIGEKIGVGSSRAAFERVMAGIPQGEENEIRIYQYRPEYP